MVQNGDSSNFVSNPWPNRLPRMKCAPQQCRVFTLLGSAFIARQTLGHGFDCLVLILSDSTDEDPNGVFKAFPWLTKEALFNGRLGKLVL